ncbi:cytochrome P460 family protein [Terriglobus sp. RCC_193]|uniref:cytochrome P460 family protein n=1 Tax=Terriglobus sp. RCC_193 TaxID=3239218 RepID=UPI003525D524
MTAVVSGLILIGGACFSSAVYARNADIPAISLPGDYRDWKLISVAHEAGALNDIRAILGNDVAVAAYRNGAQTFPDGAMIVRVAWAYTPSEENNRTFGREQSFIAGEPTNIQLMIKDAEKFKATGGWGYAQFASANTPNSVKDPANQCFHCHQAVQSRDYLFTRYAR